MSTGGRKAEDGGVCAQARLYYLLQDKSHIDPHVMILPPLRLERHLDLCKLNPRYVTRREQLLLNLEPDVYDIPDFSPEELLQSYVAKLENILARRAHDVPIDHTAPRSFSA